MSQNIDGGDGDDHPNDKPEGKIIVPRKRRFFEHGYLANNGWGVVLLCLVILFVGGILPTSDRAKLLYFVLSFVLGVILVVHGFVRRNEVTEEEVNEEFRRRTATSLIGLQTIVESVSDRLATTERKVAAQADRSLSSLEADAIRSVASNFPDQKAGILYPSINIEAERYASDFWQVLKSAGWDIPHLRFDMFITNFRNIALSINDDDHRQGNVPPAAIALLGVLRRLNLSDQVDMIGLRSDVPSGQILLLIGSRPS